MCVLIAKRERQKLKGDFDTKIATDAAIHCKLEVDSSELVFPTFNLNAFAWGNMDAHS